MTLHAPANNCTPVMIVSKKKTMSKMNLLSANKHIAAQKTKKSKKHQSTAKPRKSKNDKPRSKTPVHYSKSDIEIERKTRWKGWEAKIRAILTEMEFQGEFDEVVPEILARAEKHFAVVGGRLRKEAMRDKHVLPYVEEWKAKKEEKKEGKEGDEKGDNPPCEDSNDADDMCVGGLHDGDDDCAPACDDEDEGDNDNDRSSGVVVPLRISQRRRLSMQVQVVVSISVFRGRNDSIRLRVLMPDSPRPPLQVRTVVAQSQPRR